MKRFARWLKMWRLLPIVLAAFGCSAAPQLSPVQRVQLELAAIRVACGEARASKEPFPDEAAIACDRLLDDRAPTDGGTEQ